jgi:Flp pilus assembly protein TadG
MKTSAKTKFPKNEEGQILPWMALLMIVFIGAAGLTIDLGRGWVAYRQLQAAADAAALAGVNAMIQGNATASSVQSAVCKFSANGSASNNCSMITTSGTTTTTQAGVNTAPGLNAVSTTATLSCVTGKAYVTTTCDASTTGYNVLRVVETTTIPTFFIQALKSFGINPGNSLTMNSTSSATINASMAPLDVAILIDTTASMGQPDPNCPGTTSKEQCALNGVQGLLAALPQCAEVSPVTGNCTAYNNVSLFTFPNVTANTVTEDTTCQTSKNPTNPTVVNYTWPTLPASGDHTWTAPKSTTSTPTYQITGFSDDYYGSYNSTAQQNNLSTSSAIVIATGGTGSTNCDGLQTPGGVETYYAGAINVAQEALMAAAYGTNPQAQMVMIILSDGAANSSHVASPAGSGYGSESDECQQAIYAANNATNLGTTVYTIAYDSATTGCTTDNSNSGLSTTNSKGVKTTINMSGLSPCTTMKYMSSGWPTNTSHFYADGGSTAPCGVAGGGPSDLPTIFRQIEASFGTGRLIPNS